MGSMLDGSGGDTGGVGEETLREGRWRTIVYRAGGEGERGGCRGSGMLSGVEKRLITEAVERGEVERSKGGLF